MKIGSYDLKKDVLVIAEIGNNHEGKFPLAEKMIQAAAKAGAHAVKFQTIVPEKLFSIKQKETLELFKKYHFTYKQFAKLKKIADQEGVLFLSTPFDLESVQFLEPLVPAFKIASGDNNFWPLIEVIAKTEKPILLSSGMIDYEGIVKAKLFIENIWVEKKIQQQLAILHCVSLYPTPHSAANLFSIPFLIEKLGCTVGYSDHTIGIDSAILAVALGAKIIEKHFTLDKNYSSFPDHQISCDPQDLKHFIEKSSSTLEMLGTYDFFVGEDEEKNVKASRRSIIAKHDLKKGDSVGWSDITWARPAGGLSPGEEDKIIGKALKKVVQKGGFILTDDIIE